MNAQDASRGDEALQAAASRVESIVADIDVADDLSSTLQRAPHEPVASRHRSRRVPVVAWSAAATIIAITAGVFVLLRSSSDDIIVPADPETTVAVTATPSPEPAPRPAPAPETTTVSTEPAPSTTNLAPTTVPADSSTCLQGVDSARTANQIFVEQMLISRAGDGSFDVCLDAAPTAYGGAAPNCWTPCEPFARAFSARSVRFGEFFSPPSNEPRYSGSIAVSYSSGGESIDVVERWELTQTDTGWRFDDFAIESFPVERIPSTNVINEYFTAIEAADWTSAATFLNDGAINLDERIDLQRLAPASFELNDIAAALEALCSDGCDTRRVEPGDLTFDGGYSIERRGHVINASWFEGVYSIGGLPFRGDGSPGPETYSTADLVDGVDLAIDGPGLIRAVLFAPRELADTDSATLTSSAEGEIVVSAASDPEFDLTLLVRGDSWCSRRPVLTTNLAAAGPTGSVLNIHVGRPARVEAAERPSCADVDTLAIGLDWVEGIVGFGQTYDSATPIADAGAVATTPGGLVLDPQRQEFATPIGARMLGTAYLVADAVVWQGDDEFGRRAGPISVLTDTNEWTVEDGDRALLLLDAGIIGGRPTILLENRFANPANREQTDERLQLVDIDTGAITDLGDAFGGWETGVFDARILPESIALLRSASTEYWIELIDFEGTSLSTTPLTGDSWSLAARNDEVWAIGVLLVREDLTAPLDVVRLDVATGEVRTETIVPRGDVVDPENVFCTRVDFVDDMLLCDARDAPPIEIDVLGDAEVRTVEGAAIGAVITERRS